MIREHRARFPRRTATAALILAAAAILALGGCAPHRRPAVGPETPAQQERRLHGPRPLKVGLADDLASLTVTLGANHRLDSGENPVRSRLEVDAGGLGLTADGTSVRVRPSDGLVYRMDPPLTLRAVPGAPWTFGDHVYAGDLRIELHDGALTAVNVVDLETYLRGVVPWEIGRPGESGLAALEAQAVAARTYTISHLGERSERGFDVWADVRDQVYRGLDGTDPWCDAAIANTAGLVLRHGGREITAYYSSTCGGSSSAVEEVWPRPALAYLRSRTDALDGREAFCGGSKYASWTERWTAAELQSVVARGLPGYRDWWNASAARRRWAGDLFRPAAGASADGSVGRIRDLRIVSRTSSGRVGVLEIETDRGVWRVRGDRVRWVLTPASGSPRILRSAWFTLEVKRGGDGALTEVVASGRGFGHGIGLCQVGALKMAALGYSSRKILAHYYPGARLESAWSE